MNPLAMKGRLSTLALFLAALIVALAMAECVSRELLTPLPNAIVVRSVPVEDFGAAPVDPQKPHPLYRLIYPSPTGRRMRANAQVVVERHPTTGRDVRIDTNSLGYRNREIGPKRGRRVLFLGDSITAQDYLPEPESIVRQIETQGRGQGLDLETINAGVGAIGLTTELAILKESGLSLEPDLVVLNFYLNDFEDSRGVFVPELPPALAWSHLARRVVAIGASLGPGFAIDLRRKVGAGSPAARIRGELAARYPGSEGDWRVSPAAFNAQIQERAGDWGGAWSDVAWQRIEPLLVDLRDLSLQHGFELRIVVFPVVQQIQASYEYDQPQQRLEAVAQSLAIPVLDLLPLLRAQTEIPAEALYHDQCHPTTATSRLIASWILDFIAG